jgi:hypothetical protein
MIFVCSHTARNAEKDGLSARIDQTDRREAKGGGKFEGEGETGGGAFDQV